MVYQTYLKSIDGNFDRKLYAEKASSSLMHLSILGIKLCILHEETSPMHKNCHQKILGSPK